MLNYIDRKKMGRSQLGWLDSHFHFSFSNYYNSKNLRFGILRVINDDIIQPHTGFDTHAHQDMEIITYVVEGELTHKDSMGHERTLSRGQVQYLSAGTGITHSEHNLGDEALRLLQIWILPDQKGHQPNYGDFQFALAERNDRWMPVATSFGNSASVAPIGIHGDINMYASIISDGTGLDFEVLAGRQAYLVLIEGAAMVNTISLTARDALEVTEESIHVKALETAHILIIEMAKDPI